MSYPTPQSMRDNQEAYPIFYGPGLHTEHNPQSPQDQSPPYYTITQNQDGNQASYPAADDRQENQSTDPSDPVPSDVINTASQPDANDVTNEDPLDLSSSNIQCNIANARY